MVILHYSEREKFALYYLKFPSTNKRNTPIFLIFQTRGVDMVFWFTIILELSNDFYLCFHALGKSPRSLTMGFFRWLASMREGEAHQAVSLGLLLWNSSFLESNSLIYFNKEDQAIPWRDITCRYLRLAVNGSI